MYPRSPLMPHIVIKEFVGAAVDFRFESKLNSQLPQLLAAFPDAKSMVFNATRVSAMEGLKSVQNSVLATTASNPHNAFASLSGSTSPEDRSRIWGEYAHGKIRVLFVVYGIKIPSTCSADLVILKGCLKYSGTSSLDVPTDHELESIFSLSTGTVMILKPQVARKLEFKNFKSKNLTLEIITIQDDQPSRPLQSGPPSLRVRKGASKMTLPQDHSHIGILKDVCLKIPALKIKDEDLPLMEHINESKRTRFPIVITGEPWQKAFLAIQHLLGGGDKSLQLPQYCNLEFLRILKASKRITSALAFEFSRKKVTGEGLLNTIELEGMLNGGLWHDGEYPLLQIKGMGVAMCKSLADHSIKTIGDLRNQTPARIQMLLRRNPPFGNDIKKELEGIPKLYLEATIRQNQIKYDFSVQITRSTDLIHLLVVIDERTITHKRFCSDYKEICATINMTSKMKQIVISLMSPNYASINVHKIFNARKFQGANLGGTTKPEINPIAESGESGEAVAKFVRNHQKKLESLESVMVSKEIDKSGCKRRGPLDLRPFNRPEQRPQPANVCDRGNKHDTEKTCLHKCKYKDNCRHDCCKKKPIQRLSNNFEIKRWLSDFKFKPIMGEKTVKSSITFFVDPETRRKTFANYVCGLNLKY